MRNLFVILTLIAFAVSSAYALNEVEDSLILYLSFDELDGENVIDHSKYENHGKLVGNPKLVDGKFGKALEFNGTSDWVVIPHHETLTIDESVTVMAWINTPRYTTPGGDFWQGILTKDDFPRSYSFYTESVSQCLHFSVGAGTNHGSDCNKKVPLEEWVHVAAQIEDGSIHRYWVNGEMAGEFPGKSPPPGKADTADVLVGRTHERNREFLGRIDEVRIWDRALTEEEVIAQMEKGYIEFFHLAVDVNRDGDVNIQDLISVEAALETSEKAADVNADGTVDIQDLILVAVALSEVAAAPSAIHYQAAGQLTSADVQHWLTQAQAFNFTDATSLRGIRYLEQLLSVLIPKETALLPNYPNPFNPETWIPYQLSEPAAVRLTIYDIKGRVVRDLDLGHQRAGMYQSKSRAAYWDGKNAQGESVASGVYFYMLKAGTFTATRKMLILK